MNWFRNLSLGTRINLTIVVAMALIATAILGVETKSTNTLIDEIGQSRIAQEVVLIEQQLLQAQNGLETAATVLANTPGLVEAVETGNKSALRTLTLSAVPALRIEDFDIIDSQMNRLVDTAEALTDDETGETDIIEQSLLGIQRTTLLQEVHDGETQLLIVSIRPLRDENATIVGGLLIAREINTEFLNELNAERQGVELSVIVDNKVITHTFASNEHEASTHGHNNFPLHTGLIATALDGTSAINPEIIDSDDGIPHSEAFIPIQGLDDRHANAVLAIRVNNSAITVFQQNLFASSSTLIFLIAILVVTAMIFIVRLTVIRRITLLEHTASAIAEGDYAQRVNITGQDEIGKLSTAFNQMASDIQVRQRELQELNTSLEQRVEERTAEIRASEARFHQLANSIDETFFLISIDLQEAYYISPNFEKLFGYPTEMIYEDPSLWMKRIHPDDQHLVMAGFEQLKRGEPFVKDFRIIRSDGTICWIENRVSLTENPGGKSVTAAGVAIDITERKEVETQRETLIKELEIARRVAEENSRLKDEFLSVMSHELRTPLNAIIGFQGIMLMQSELDERSTHMVRRAQANARRLLSLINDILDISRIESGRLQLVPVEINVQHETEKWRSQMGVLADEKNIGFEVNIDDQLPEILYADEDAVTKIVTNLLGNAIKFTDEGTVSLNLSQCNGEWIIEVMDTGVGIPHHMHDIIFERFRQVDGSSTRKHGGTGLGLAIVRNLCQAMGGNVILESEPGKGSKFTVNLPLVTTAEGEKLL